MCEKIGQILLVIINIVFFLGGAILLALGIIALVDEGLLYKLTDIVTDTLSKVIENVDKIAKIDFAGLIKTNAIILIVIGSILFILGVLGVCGARTMSKTLLKMYSLIVVLILIAEVGLGVYAYMYADQFEDKLTNGLVVALYKTYKKGLRENSTIAGNLVASKEVQEYGMDSLQLELACCGISNRSEWKIAAEWNNTYAIRSFGATVQAVYPPSCCILNDTSSKNAGFLEVPVKHFTDLQNCMTNHMTNHVQKTPCYERLKKLITDNKFIIVIVIVILVAVEVLGILSAFYLISKAK